MGEKRLFQPKVTKLTGPCAYPLYSCPFVAFLPLPRGRLLDIKKSRWHILHKSPKSAFKYERFQCFFHCYGRGGNFGLFLSTCREVLCHPACLVVYTDNPCKCAKHLVMRVSIITELRHNVLTQCFLVSS